MKMGADGWESYQNCNDLAAIREKFGKQLVFVGAPDVRRYAGRSNQSDEEIETAMRELTEMLRCYRGYLPDSDIRSCPRYAAVLHRILPE